jgi:hypothetical protein
MDLITRVEMKLMEKVAINLTPETVAKLVARRSAKHEAGSIFKKIDKRVSKTVLDLAGAGSHPAVTDGMKGHVFVNDDAAERVGEMLGGVKHGKSTKDLIMNHELDEAMYSLKAAKDNVSMRDFSSGRIASHIDPGVIMKESNMIRRVKASDPDTHNFFTQMRTRDGATIYSKPKTKITGMDWLSGTSGMSESDALHHLSGKRYGVDHFSNDDIMAATAKHKEFMLKNDTSTNKMPDMSLRSIKHIRNAFQYGVPTVGAATVGGLGYAALHRGSTPQS